MLPTRQSGQAERAPPAGASRAGSSHAPLVFFSFLFSLSFFLFSFFFFYFNIEKTFPWLNNVFLPESGVSVYNHTNRKRPAPETPGDRFMLSYKNKVFKEQKGWNNDIMSKSL